MREIFSHESYSFAKCNFHKAVFSLTAKNSILILDKKFLFNHSMDEKLIEALEHINKRLDALELSTNKENCATEVNNSDDSSRPVDRSTNNGDSTTTGRSGPRSTDQQYYDPEQQGAYASFTQVQDHLKDFDQIKFTKFTYRC